MGNKTWLYSGLLVVILALVGVGIWLVQKPVDKVEIPETDPWMMMDISFLEEGSQSQLSIYDDGTMIYWEDTGLPGSLSPDPTRTWRTGKLDSEEMDDLTDLLDTVGFNDLEEYYLSSAIPEDEDIIIDDNYLKISVDDENTVTAHGYFEPMTSSAYYPLPDPLAEIREKLDDIIENYTEEALVEDLSME